MIKEYILERKGWFKGCKLRVEDDYNEEVCNTRKQLVEYMFEARRRGEHAVLIRDKVLISGFQYDLEACRKNFRRGEEDTKERVKERTRTNEEGKIEVEITRKRKESRKREENKEEKRINEKKDELIETKEQLEKNILDNGYEIVSIIQKGITEFTERMDKAVQKGIDQIRGDSKEESEDNRHELPGRQDQRNDKNVELTQQPLRNDDLAVVQKLETIVMNQRVGEWPEGKGNDLQGRHRGYNKTFASRNEYFLRNKLANKHEK